MHTETGEGVVPRGGGEGRLDGDAVAEGVEEVGVAGDPRFVAPGLEVDRRLGLGELSLEEMIKHFEEGSKLVEVCSKKLNEVEQKIEKLVKKDGELKEIPFEVEE